MTTRKTIVLTILTHVGEIMYLFLNILSRFVIAFLPKASIIIRSIFIWI